jgi:hypothetical protein
MATEEQLAAFQTAVASGNIQEAANIAALAGYSPQQVAEYVNANAPILGLGPETGFSGVTAANLDPALLCWKPTCSCRLIFDSSPVDPNAEKQ